MTAARSTTPTLRVYVAPGCAGCRTALEVVEAVRRARPAQRVEVVDLADQPARPLPDGVVGTPAYVIGEHLVSLGNPDLAELLGHLDSAAKLLEDE
ncbi:MAG: thioredoxin family protein [Haloechinothrix sp.]